MATQCNGLRGDSSSTFRRKNHQMAPSGRPMTGTKRNRVPSIGDSAPTSMVTAIRAATTHSGIKRAALRARLALA